MSQRDGSGIKFEAGGKGRLQTPTDLDVMVNQNNIESVLGDKQIHVGRDTWVNLEGNSTVYLGKQGSKEIAAAKQLNNIGEQIQKQAIQAASKAEGEWVQCPVCSQRVLEDKSLTAIICIFRIIDYVADKIPYMSDWLERLQKLMQRFPAIPIARPMIVYNKKKSCGPGCKNGRIRNPRASMKAAEQAVLGGLKKNEYQINEANKNIGHGGGFVFASKGSFVINTGLAKNQSDVFYKSGFHTYPTGFIDGENGGPMILKSSTVERMIHLDPVRTGGQGDMLLNVSEKFTLNAGSPGIDVSTKGLTKITGGGIEVRASEGEALFSSNNLTLIEGRSIKISGSGAGSSITLEADNVHIPQIASVGATLNVKGGLNTDGPISVPYLNVPGVNQRVSVSKPTQMCTGASNTFYMGTAVRMMSLAKDMMGKISLPGTWVMNTDNMMSLVDEVLDMVKMCIPIDPVMAGFSVVVTLGYSACGPVISSGISLMMPLCPVFLFPHNHSMFSMEHSGSVTVPLGNYFNTSQGVFQARGVNSPSPAFPPAWSNIGSRPGPQSNPDGCVECGNNSGAVPNYNLDPDPIRNREHGVDANDPFKDGDGVYVNRYTSLKDPLSDVDLLPAVEESPDFSFYKYVVVPSLTGCNESPECFGINR
jgi:hypothetical protein